MARTEFCPSCKKIWHKTQIEGNTPLTSHFKKTQNKQTKIPPNVLTSFDYLSQVKYCNDSHTAAATSQGYCKLYLRQISISLLERKQKPLLQALRLQFHGTRGLKVFWLNTGFAS